MVGICLLLMTFSAGCKTKRVLEKSPLLLLSDNALMNLVEMNKFSFESLNAKASVLAESEVQNGSFKINLRMKTDSAVWISVTPALGIEAARVLLQPDTLKFIDKLNNKYYLGSYDILDSLINYYAEFELMENLLTGNPIQISPDEKYTASVDGLNYVLSTKAKRKLRKSVESKGDPSSAASYDVVKEKKLEKALEKYDDQDLILKQYFVRPGDFKVIRTQIEDLLYKRNLIVEYSLFEDVEGQPFPMKIKILASSPNQSATFELHYSRIRINEPQSYPFRVPDKFSPLR